MSAVRGKYKSEEKKETDVRGGQIETTRQTQPVCVSTSIHRTDSYIKKEGVEKGERKEAEGIKRQTWKVFE